MIILKNIDNGNYRILSEMFNNADYFKIGNVITQDDGKKYKIKNIDYKKNDEIVDIVEISEDYKEIK